MAASSTLHEKMQADRSYRENGHPNVPPAPSLSTSRVGFADGKQMAVITTTWTPVRTDLRYIVRHRRAGDTAYVYADVRTSPHVIRLVETGANISVSIAAERRLGGARSGFSAETTITT